MNGNPLVDAVLMNGCKKCIVWTQHSEWCQEPGLSSTHDTPEIRDTPEMFIFGGLFDKDHLDATTAQLAAASGTAPDNHQARDLELRRQLKECDAKLSKYRA